jgi:hypothetical protein
MMPVAFTSPQEVPWPTSTAELDPSERFIVWAFRRWVLGLNQNNGEHWSFVWNEFARQFGIEDGKAALAAFAGLIKNLQCHARRAIRLHQPCCPCLVVDEVALVCFVAACQNSQPHRARGLAEWLVHPDGAGEMLAAAARLAQIMRKHALNLPHRSRKEAVDTVLKWPDSAKITIH